MRANLPLKFMVSALKIKAWVTGDPQGVARFCEMEMEIGDAEPISRPQLASQYPQECPKACPCSKKVDVPQCTSKEIWEVFGN